MSLMIEAEGLTKSFGKIVALDGLDARLEQGQVTAVLGPNGAGKTTFLRMISTLVRPDSGTLRVFAWTLAIDPDAPLAWTMRVRHWDSTEKRFDVDHD